MDWVRTAIVVGLVACISILPQRLSATPKRWNGLSSALWNDNLNWTPGGIPAETDEVLLDNTFITNDYFLSLPDSTTAIASLTISPAAGRKIQLIIPTSNKTAPALSLSSSSNSLVLNAGAVLKNSSGLTSGQSIAMNGKFVIRNGGLYLHNTRASHATGLVAKLSIDAGTERGEFVFDVPGGAYSLSLSNRTYGTLRLQAASSDGSQTYNATGSSVCNIRGNLEIEKGVTCNLDLEKTLAVEGDFIQTGGVFNLATQPNNLQLALKGSAVQSAGATITETSSGQPLIVFNGSSQQRVSMNGTCLNSIGFMLDNPWGLLLEANLQIPYALQLKSGKIQSSSAALLEVEQNASITGASDLSFVDGPVVKTGNEDFQFPVGRQGDFAPLKLTGANAVDTVTVEYNHGNPQELFGTMIESPPILRVSSLEYWTINRVGPSPSGTVSLAVGAYSHATRLADLVVTGWDETRKMWSNCGNSSYSGISSGLITSNAVAASGVFTVGTTVADQNPLPVYFESLNAIWTNGRLTLTWRAHNQQPSDWFAIEFSQDGINFQRDTIIEASPLVSDYVYEKATLFKGQLYARVIMLEGGEKNTETQEIFVKYSFSSLKVSLYPVPASTNLHVNIVAAGPGPAELRVIDILGRKQFFRKLELMSGVNDVDIPLWDLQSGLYFLQILREATRPETFPFLVRQ